MNQKSSYSKALKAGIAIGTLYFVPVQQRSVIVGQSSDQPVQMVDQWRSSQIREQIVTGRHCTSTKNSANRYPWFKVIRIYKINTIRNIEMFFSFWIWKYYWYVSNLLCVDSAPLSTIHLVNSCPLAIPWHVRWLDSWWKFCLMDCAKTQFHWSLALWRFWAWVH